MFQNSVNFGFKNRIDMTTQIAEQPKSSPRKKRSVPAYLVRETIDGIPFYYRGYRSVLNKTKTFDEIMGDSGLQLFLKNYLGDVLREHLDLKKFYVFVGEGGAHLNHRSNFSLDLTVYDKSVLTPGKITTKYVDVPPKLVIEVDVNVELPDKTQDLFEEFVLRKVRRLFDFGTERVIWVFSKSRTVIIASPGGHWEVQDWDKDLELWPGISTNIVRHLQKEGINLF